MYKIILVILVTCAVSTLFGQRTIKADKLRMKNADGGRDRTMIGISNDDNVLGVDSTVLLTEYAIAKRIEALQEAVKDLTTSEVWNLTASASQVTLEEAPITNTDIIVLVNGLVEYDYTVQGSIIQFDFTLPDKNNTVEVIYYK